MIDITSKEAIEILSHYTDLGYGVVIEGEDTSKIKQALSLANKALANGTPYNPSGDCISREALKEALKSNCKPELCHEYNTAWCESCCPKNDFEDLIDNASTVDLWQMRQEATENALKKAEVLYARPKGEWIKIDEEWCDYKCSVCGEKVKRLYPFCHCGADMRKGGVE